MCLFAYLEGVKVTLLLQDEGRTAYSESATVWGPWTMMETFLAHSERPTTFGYASLSTGGSRRRTRSSNPTG